MATYGRGQMLGSGINPESFKLDFSGFADAAATQAQGVANLGASIGGAISEVGDYFKKQKEDEKKVQKSLSVAKAIGDLIPGLQPTIKGSLDILNDKEIPLSQRTAEADAIADILNLGINEVRNRQDFGLRERALGIQEAQFEAENAPPMPAPLTYKRVTNVPYGGGFLDDLLIGSDGQYYDEAGNLVADMGAFARGESPEVYSGYSTFSDDLGSIDTPLVVMPGENPAANIDAKGIDAALDGGVLPPEEEIAQLERQLGIDENKRKEIQSSISPKKSRIRFDADKEELQDPVTITMEELNKLSASGVRAEGSLNPDGTFSVTGFKTGSLPQGMTIESDGQGGITVVQGAGVGAKTEKAERAAKFEETRQTNFIIDKANEAEEIIDESISTYGAGTLIDMAKSAFPGTQEYKLKNQILPAIKDSIALSSLKQLKAASPTGASGLGSLTEKEGKRLENMYGVLDVGGDKVTLKNDIKRLKQTAFDYIHGSKSEREEALANGDITKDQNDQVEQMYREQILGVSAPKAPASSIPRSEEIEAIRKKYLTPNDQ
jgi:hypothetical protein